MAIVYIVQDDGSKNFAPALKYGTFSPLSNKDFPRFDVEKGKDIVKYLQAKLSLFNVEKDFLLLTGDPILIGLCIHIILQKSCTIKLLKWDKQTKQYIPILVSIGE